MGAVAVAAAVLAGVGAGPVAEGASRADDRVSTVRSECTGKEVRRVVFEFVKAFDHGDLRQLNHLFSPAGLFKWYSVSGPQGRLQAAALDRSTLVGYFASRHDQSEQLVLHSFTYKGYSGGYGEFLYSLTRSAVDLEAASYFGKGAVLCLRPRTIAVWSMGPQ